MDQPTEPIVSTAKATTVPIQTIGSTAEATTAKRETKVSTVKSRPASTASSQPGCVFPFKYRGKTYNECTKVRHNQPWCSKDAVYIGRWKNCDGLCCINF